jgi:predicted DCC family thiol-disulfide oxidoreductase YuxK
MVKTFIIFDTNCILCSGFVRFILVHERTQDIHFVNAWSETGSTLAAEYGYTTEDLQKTFLVISNGKAFIKSNGFFEVTKSLKMPWRAFQLFRIVPHPLRDWAYTFVAENRYKWFGYEENCLFISPEERHRFVL